jgi:hypothetical protein
MRLDELEVGTTYQAKHYDDTVYVEVLAIESRLGVRQARVRWFKRNGEPAEGRYPGWLPGREITGHWEPYAERMRERWAVADELRSIASELDDHLEADRFQVGAGHLHIRLNLGQARELLRRLR